MSIQTKRNPRKLRRSSMMSVVRVLDTIRIAVTVRIPAVFVVLSDLIPAVNPKTPPKLAGTKLRTHQPDPTIPEFRLS